MTITVEWHYALCIAIFLFCFWKLHDDRVDVIDNFTIAFMASCVPNFIIMVVQYEAKRWGWW